MADSSNTYQTSFPHSIFEGMELGKVEAYDASQLNCWPFRKSTDIRDNITLSLGNLCKGYSFSLYGKNFHNSESAYLVGEFSQNTAQDAAIQQALMNETNAFVAKKVIKRKNESYIRTDWEEIRLQWMLYVVWQKCIGNADFRNLLLSLPKDAVIIEDSTNNHGATSTVWGAKNKELNQVRKARKKELCKQYADTMKKKDLDRLVTVECNKINDIGVFTGENNMGKILKMCQLAIIYKVVPPIDYAFLADKKIYLLGELLTFEEDMRKVGEA